MTKQLTPQQIAEIKALLQPLGLNVTKARKSRTQALDYLTKVKAWKPETAAGRACKSSMLYWASLPPIRDYSKPCVDTLLRWLGVRSVDPLDLISLGGFTPKNLWVVALTRSDVRQIAQ